MVVIIFKVFRSEIFNVKIIRFTNLKKLYKKILISSDNFCFIYALERAK